MALSICDTEPARKSAGSALMGQTQFAVEAANMSSVAAAQAEVTLNEAAKSICDRPLATSVRRGYQIASNFGGTFSSDYTVFYASLPSSAGHQRAMITG